MTNRKRLAVAAIVAGVAIALTWFHAIQGAAFSVVQGDERATSAPSAVPPESEVSQAVAASEPISARPVELPPLTCVGRVVDERRFPVAGAQVSLHLPGFERFDLASDEAGEFALEIPQRGLGALLGGVYATDGERAAVRGCTSEGTTQQLDVGTLTLAEAQALTVRVRHGGRPAAGARVRLLATQRRWPLFVRRADAAGRALFPPLPRGMVFVEAAAHGYAGRAALFLPQTGGAELVVELEPARAIELSVARSTDGAPLPDATIVVLERLADTSSASVPFDCDLTPTDANGRARIVELPIAGSFSVRVEAAGFAAQTADVLLDTRELAFELLPGGAAPDGAAPDGDGDAIDASVARPEEQAAPVTLTLRLRIDGSPRLPPEYELCGPPGVRVLREDPASGELQLAGAPEAPETRPLTLLVAGFLPVELVLGGDSTVDVELQRAAELVGRVVLPAVGHAVIVAQQRDSGSDDWRALDDAGLRAPNGPEGSFCFEGLDAGVYRIRDERTGRASGELELARGARGEVFLDLGAVHWVTGRVELPSGTDASLVRIRDLAHEPSTPAALVGRAPPAGIVPHADGSFELMLPNGSPVTLSPWHPWLASAGSVQLASGRAGVELRLVPCDEVELPLHSALDGLLPGLGVRVLVYDGVHDGEPFGEPRAVCHAPVVDGVARFGVEGRGRLTFWIDLGQKYAPAVVQVELRKGTTRLAEPSFSTGSAIHVKAPGARGTRLRISALHWERPCYSREVETVAAPDAILGGLGPGTFEVRIEPLDAPERTFMRSVELDGARIVELELPTRR